MEHKRLNITRCLRKMGEFLAFWREQQRLSPFCVKVFDSSNDAFFLWFFLIHKVLMLFEFRAQTWCVHYFNAAKVNRIKHQMEH